MERKNARRLNLGIDLLPAASGFGAAAAPTSDHRRIMAHYASPLLFGPPPSDLLLEFVTHVYTEEEARFGVHLPPLRPRTAAVVARRAGASVAEAERTLDHLAFGKAVILAFGDPRRYTILPVVPGTFEMALMTPDLSSRNEWHRRFAALFERLVETGFMADYPGNPRQPFVSYLPVGRPSGALYAAWPADHLAEAFEPFDEFAVGHCQCRLAMRLVGRGCGRPMDNCVAFGPITRAMVDRGLMRRIDRAEAIAIKREAERAGCVSWMMNYVDPDLGGGSCSCCGCCCHAMRIVRDSNVPGLISRPRYRPGPAEQSCSGCGLCVRACPMEALTMAAGRPALNPARCIGCGLCAASCSSGALTLVPVAEESPRPSPTRFGLLRLAGPQLLGNALRVWVRRGVSGLGGRTRI